MAEPYIIDDDNFENDALRQAVKSYKDAMRAPAQDLDLEYLIKTLRSVNEDSPVKIACNPVSSDRKWNAETKLYNVRSVEVDVEGHLAIHIRKDNKEFTVAQFIDQYAKVRRKVIDKKGPVKFIISDDKSVTITDVYSHALLGDRLAGLPLDLVLGYFEEDPKAKAAPKAEPASE